VEPVKQHWKDVGIYLDLEVVERSLAITRGAANETQLSAWNNDGTEHPWSFPFHLVWLSITTGAPGGPEYARWFHSGGKEGKEPTGRIREMMDLWVQGMGVSEEERITLGKRIWQIAAEDVYIIGIVGPGASSALSGQVLPRVYASPRSIWGTCRHACTSAPMVRRRVSLDRSLTSTSKVYKTHGCSGTRARIARL